MYLNNVKSMNLGRIQHLKIARPIQETLQDEERQEIRAKGKELFSGRTINWDKLGMVGRVRAQFSSEYETKVREEFKDYIQEKLIKNMNGRVQTYLNNNLTELKESIQQIKDLSLTDIKDLTSIIQEKETALANKYFAEEREKLVTDLINRKCFTQEQANAFMAAHPEHQTIASREDFATLRDALYKEFVIPQSERL